MLSGPSCWVVNGARVRPLRLEEPSPCAMATPGFVAVVGRGRVAEATRLRASTPQARNRTMSALTGCAGSPWTRWLLSARPGQRVAAFAHERVPALRCGLRTAIYETDGRPGHLQGHYASETHVRNQRPTRRRRNEF